MRLASSGAGHLKDPLNSRSLSAVASAAIHVAVVVWLSHSSSHSAVTTVIGPPSAGLSWITLLPATTPGSDVPETASYQDGIGLETVVDLSDAVPNLVAGNPEFESRTDVGASTPSRRTLGNERPILGGGGSADPFAGAAPSEVTMSRMSREADGAVRWNSALPLDRRMAEQLRQTILAKTRLAPTPMLVCFDGEGRIADLDVETPVDAEVLEDVRQVLIGRILKGLSIVNSCRVMDAR